MKKLILFILPLLAITLNSCSKDDDGDNGGKDNQLTINGQTYEFVNGEYYNGDNTPGEIGISFEVKGISQGAKEFVIIDFDEIYVPNNGTKPVAGTYTYKDNQAAYTFSASEIYNDDIGYEEEITGGTVTISVSGSTYTIKLNCTLSGGGTLKGTYKGALEEWSDEYE